MRVFRNYAPYRGMASPATTTRSPAVANINATFKVATGYRFVVNTQGSVPRASVGKPHFDAFRDTEKIILLLLCVSLAPW